MQITDCCEGEHEKEYPGSLDCNETRKLLAQPNSRYLSGYRNRVMLLFMLDTGLRLSEGINLQWKAIDLNSGKTKQHMVQIFILGLLRLRSMCGNGL